MISQSKKPSSNFRLQLKYWLVKHPSYNPYKFSIRNFFKTLTGNFRLLPNFIIIGAGRAGTTSLYRYITQHPNVLPSTTKDSNNEFADLHFFEYKISNSVNWYKSHFPLKFLHQSSVSKNKQNFITGEFTATYMYHPLVPKRIFNLLPKTKLILVLRNPVDKAFSTYNQQKNYKQTNLKFQEIIQSEIERIKFLEVNSQKFHIQSPDDLIIPNILRHGIYAKYIENWLKSFPLKQIFIINSDDLENSTQKVLDELFTFLELPSYKIPDISKVNTGNYHPMPKTTREFLLNFYEPYNKKLYELIGRSFDWEK